MKTAIFVPLAIALATLTSPAEAQQSTQTRNIVLRAGNWYVVRSNQTASGAVACSGFYMGQDGVELRKDKLVVKLPGEPKSIGLRFGDEPPRAPRAPDANERQTGAVVLAGADFEQLRRSKSVSLDVATAQGRANPTLKLEGLNAAVKSIDAGCPVPAASVRAERALQKKREKALAERCSPAGIARMREQGLNDLRIMSACPKAALPAR
jgi:hypothetical protein